MIWVSVCLFQPAVLHHDDDGDEGTVQIDIIFLIVFNVLSFTSKKSRNTNNR